jgi:membrane protein DedA with SNARE-associated domain
MVPLIEFVITFLVAFGLNLIPFLGPSNLLIASTAAISLVNPDPATLVTIGFLIALAASLAKGIYYVVTFFVSKHLSEKNRRRLDAEAVKVKPWAFLLLYLAAATPIPDEPVVIPLGLMKYNPAKFFLAYFLGKISITIAGAFLGRWTETYFSSWLSQEVMIALSIVLTVIVTIIMFKVDVGKWLDKIFKRRQSSQKAAEQPEEQS